MMDLDTIQLMTFGASCVIVGYGMGLISTLLVVALINRRLTHWHLRKLSPVRIADPRCLRPRASARPARAMLCGGECKLKGPKVQTLEKTFIIQDLETWVAGATEVKAK